MNESYQRSLTSALERIERDLIALERACRAPARGALYREQLDAGPAVALDAIARTLTALGTAARAFDIRPRVISLPWYGRVQSISHLVALEDLEPARVGLSYGRLGEPDEIERVASVLTNVSLSIAKLRDTLGSIASPGAALESAADGQ